MRRPEAGNGDFQAAEGRVPAADYPVGGENLPPDTVEAGLRALARDAGPSIAKLLSDEPGPRAIMQLSETPPGWSREDKASAIMALIRELVETIRNPRWRAAAQAALRTPPERFPGAEYDTLQARWREIARPADEGASADDAERYRGYWRTNAAEHLAALLRERVLELNRNGTLTSYRRGQFQPPPLRLPISFDRTEVLYRFDGYRGIDSTSYRWLRAHGPVDHYETVGWYYNDPDAAVQITPLANCVLDGPLLDLPQGGRCGRLRFPRTVQEGQSIFFAYNTRFNSDRECRPTILYEVRGLTMEALVIRAQFDPPALPERIWHFDVSAQSDGLRTPDDGSPELLQVASNGYVEHEFLNCQQGRKYGLRWVWRRETFVGEG